MITIPDPNTVVATLDPDSIPDNETQDILLPGRTEPHNALTGKQVRVLVRAALEDEAAQSMTWANWIATMRKLYVRGNQYDFNIVTGVIEAGYERASEDPMTKRMKSIRTDIVGCLAGTAEHWHRPIEDRVRRSSPRLVEQHLLDWMSVRTRGEFSSQLDLFGALFGQIPNRKDRLNALLDGDQDDTGDGEKPLLNGDEEPF